MRRAVPSVRRLGTLVQRGSQARKAKVVVLGSGWGGNKVARDLDKKLYDVQVISPANHFLFTPLLPSTAVGTLEFRAVQEPIRTIDGLGNYYQAKARTLDLSRRVLHCEDAFKKRPFQVAFDYLILLRFDLMFRFGFLQMSIDWHRANFAFRDSGGFCTQPTLYGAGVSRNG